MCNCITAKQTFLMGGSQHQQPARCSKSFAQRCDDYGSVSQVIELGSRITLPFLTDNGYSMCIVNVQEQVVFFLQLFQFIDARAASHRVHAIANVCDVSVLLQMSSSAS